MIRFALVIALVAFGTALADHGVSQRDADARPSVSSAPDIVDQMGGGSLWAVAVRGDTLFVGEGPRVVAYDQSAFAKSGRLVRLGASEVLTGSVRHLAMIDDRLLALQYGVGLAILDTGDPHLGRAADAGRRDLVAGRSWPVCVRCELPARRVRGGPRCSRQRSWM